MAFTEPRLPPVLPLATTLLRAGFFQVPVVREVLDALYDTYKRRESLPFFPSDANLKGYDVVIDVGAGLGFFTRWMYDHTPSTTKILSFEPDAHNCAILHRRVAACNDLDRITIYQAAISNRSGPVPFARNLAHFGDHAVDPLGTVASQAGREAVVVHAMTLSEVIRPLSAEAGSILIKLDVQGHEPFVLQSLTPDALGGNRCDVLTEFSPYHLHAQGTNPQEFLAHLANRSDRCLFRDARRNFIDIAHLSVETIGYTDVWCENFKVP